VRIVTRLVTPSLSRAVVVVAAAVVAVVAVVAFGGAACPTVRRPPLPVPLPFAMPDRPTCDGGYDDAVAVAAVQDPALREVSGLAASLQNPQILWAVADAGNAAAVFAVSSTSGAVRLRIDLPVANVDFEEVTVGPCPDLTGPCVYVGDVGDNDLVRTAIAVYAFAEPVIEADSAGTLRLDSVWQLPLQFPDEESVDVEAFVVGNDAQAMLFFEKTLRGEARIFAARSPWTVATNTESEPALLEEVGSVAPPAADPGDRTIAGAALHWSGRRLLLRFKAGLAEYEGASAADFFDLASSTPLTTKPAPANEGGRGEALGWSESGTDLFSIAEADNGELPVLQRMNCR